MRLTTETSLENLGTSAGTENTTYRKEREGRKRFAVVGCQAGWALLGVGSPQSLRDTENKPTAKGSKVRCTADAMASDRTLANTPSRSLTVHTEAFLCVSVPLWWMEFNPEERTG